MNCVQNLFDGRCVYKQLHLFHISLCTPRGLNILNFSFILLLHRSEDLTYLLKVNLSEVLNFYSNTKMRYVAAYLLAVLGQKPDPSVADLEKILSSVGIEADKDKVSKVVSELKGKKLEDLIAEGQKKLASMPAGGGAVAAAAPAAAAGGDAPKAKEAEKKKEESEEEDDDMGFGLFD